jgi:hypothetical protein
LIEEAAIVVPSYVHVGGKENFLNTLISDKASLGDCRELVTTADVIAAVENLESEFTALQEKAVVLEEVAMNGSDENCETMMRTAGSRSGGWIMWLHLSETHQLQDILPAVFIPGEGYTPPVGKQRDSDDEGGVDWEDDAIVQETVDKITIDSNLIKDSSNVLENINAEPQKKKRAAMKHVAKLITTAIAGSKEMAIVASRLLNRISDGTILVDDSSKSFIHNSATMLPG